MTQLISWALLVVGVLGFLISFPLWLLRKLSDRAMIGITLVLSWAALWYSAYLALLETGAG